MSHSQPASPQLPEGEGRSRWPRLRRWLDPYVQWNWAWNVDAAIRYGAVINRIQAAGLIRQPLRVCDVGCGARGGFSSYMPVPVVGIDVAFAPHIVRQFPLCAPVIASGGALPLPSGAFDLVVCMDVLEHIPREARPRFVDELFRVAGQRGWVFVGAPCGPAVQELERGANQRYRERTGRDHPWLNEHLAYEVLQQEELEAWVSQSARAHMEQFQMESFPSMSLAAWRVLHPLWHHPILMHVQRPLFRPWARWLIRWSGPPSYRWFCSARAVEERDAGSD